MTSSQPSSGKAVTAAMSRTRRSLAGVFVFSLGINVLMLAGPLYMLQVYDRVLTGNSVETLIGLTIFVVGAYGFQAALEIIRGRIVARSADVFDGELQDRAHDALLKNAAHGNATGAAGPLRDIDQIRNFIMSPGPIAMLDSPWVPVFLFICFLIHPWLGLVALAGALVLLGLALLTERASRPISKVLAGESNRRALALEARRRSAESIMAMGMGPAMTARWKTNHDRFASALRRSSDVVGGFGSISKVVRLLLQSAILGLGAFLVIRQELTSGAMIAASIMMGRGLAPIEGAISQWRGFIGARQSYRRLREALDKTAPAPQTALPAPHRSLKIEGLAIAPPGVAEPAIENLNFSLESGEALGIVGPSGVGKSTLARVLVGIWQGSAGTVRLDGAELDQWRAEDLGPHIGYLSQSVEIFDGTISENIARLELEPDSEAVIRAAKAAGAHEMILQLPFGYDTNAGEWGSSLSAGQRQRVGLARALYKEPALVVLDEPNSNLDHQGELALLSAIKEATERGAMVVLITHKIGLLSACQKALILAGGEQKAFGPRDEILKRFAGPLKPAQSEAPARTKQRETSAAGVAR